MTQNGWHIMTYITVSDDQLRQIESATFPIVFVDESGRPLVKATESAIEPELPPGVTPEYWAELQRRMNEPGEYKPLAEIKKRLGW
jgi:hypothetical protein